MYYEIKMQLVLIKHWWSSDSNEATVDFRGVGRFMFYLFFSNIRKSLTEQFPG